MKNYFSKSISRWYFPGQTMASTLLYYFSARVLDPFILLWQFPFIPSLFFIHSKFSNERAPIWYSHNLILFIIIFVSLSYKSGLNVTHYLSDNCINYRESNTKNLSPTFSTNSLHYKLLPQFPQSVATDHPSSKHSCKFSPFS